MEYQYDQLGRLISAATQGAGGWGLAWNHDGFGNLTQQSVIKGSLTGFTLGINGATNRVTGQNYDANGNWLGSYGQGQTYDVDNRVRTAGSHYHQETYLYSARNERMVSQRDQAPHRVHFYGADGLLLGIYSLEITQNQSYTYPVRLADQERLYFGGRLMQIGGEWVATDRLGSVVRKGTTNYKYAPYGQEIGGATANDTVKFATYTRDSVSGLDYALNRYYKPEWGRFTSPDPYQASGGPADPGSWNRYAYVGGDPVNRTDRLGLYWDWTHSYLEAPDGGALWFWSEPTGYGLWNAYQNYYNPEGPVFGGNFPGAVVGGGGGQVAPPPPQDRQLLQGAFDKAIEALRDPDCRAIYGSGGTGLDPATVLTSMKDGGRYGSIHFENQGPRFGVAQTQPRGFPRPSTATGVRFPRVRIVINSYNDENLYWNDSDIRENTDTLLHELGHALRFLGVSGGSFRQLDNSDENQQFNRSLINENCLKKIQW